MNKPQRVAKFMDSSNIGSIFTAALFVVRKVHAVVPRERVPIAESFLLFVGCVREFDRDPFGSDLDPRVGWGAEIGRLARGIQQRRTENNGQHRQYVVKVSSSGEGRGAFRVDARRLTDHDPGP